MIAVVLAGGSGTRFWPLSRSARPKQLIRLYGEGTMISQTVERLQNVSSLEKTLVVCGQKLLPETREALQNLDAKSFIAEPFARNTAPAIGLAAIHAQARFGDEVMGIFPSDHFIEQLDDFDACLRAACREAELGKIVTMGIKPTSPETGYGYIAFDHSQHSVDAPDSLAQHPAFPVQAFVEKPDRERAQTYLDAGNYAWNSGMFVFKPSVLLAEMQRQQPKMYAAMLKIAAAIDTPQEDQALTEHFEHVDNISIDYAIMENAPNVVVIPASFKWSDVGHWAAIEDVTGTDRSNNVVEANTALIDVTNSVLYSTQPKRVIAALGIDNLVIVDTPDALLILPKDRAQDVRALVDLLKNSDNDDVL